MLKNRKKLLLIGVCALLAAQIFLFFWLQSPVQSQSGTSTAVVVTKPQPAPVVNNSPLFTALRGAAAENSRLRNNLNWTFGNKQQRGWNLYIPLVQRLIGSENTPDSPEFALALAWWQQQSGVAPTGTLNNETLHKMIEGWQSKRIANRVYPRDEQLLTAPITDFYDPTRSVELLKVEREAYSAYKQMVRAAIADPTLDLKTTSNGELAPEEKRLKIISSFRSREYQEKLRKASPNSGSAGLAVNSPHFTGRALDIYVGGDPVETKDFNRSIQVNTPVYKWLVKNAERFGFYPYYYEPWHWEYVPENAKPATALPAR